MSAWYLQCLKGLRWYEKVYLRATRNTIWTPMPWRKCWCCNSRAEWVNPAIRRNWCMFCKYAQCEKCYE